ncbi:uncharacterized protein [Ptychodera flava]|uniref:uncharacterized protein n=1 Tax=Ptychodera flava TaxID=63121 RepID=UPI00396A4069
MEYRRWKVRATSLAVLVILLIASVRGNGVKVRLDNGSSPYDGLVEVYVNDSTGWLPVCGTQEVKNFVDADVVCNQLGYNGTMILEREEGHLRNDSRKVVDRLACQANSITIDDCSYDIEEPGHCNDIARITCNFDGYIGCFKNDANNPVLPNDEAENNQMTIEWCLDYCRERNWTYAGLYQRTHCHCGRQGTDYAKEGELLSHKCNAPCGGNKQQICGSGGKGRISLYTTHLGACGGQVHVTGSRTIYSPGFPGYYPNFQDCTWTLSSSNASNFMISFVFLNLNKTDDNIALYDVIDGKRNIIRQFNGSDAPEVVFSCSSEVLVHFLSGNSNISNSGMFALTFKEAYTACPLPREINHGHFKVTGDCTKNLTLSVTCKEGLQLTTSYSSVLCYKDLGWNDSIPNCIAEVPVKLTDGVLPNEGFVEVFDSEHGWLKVCLVGKNDGTWNWNAANVVCTQLGYPGAMRPTFGKQSADDIFGIASVNCKGEENSILECTYLPTNSCTHLFKTKCNYRGYFGCYGYDTEEPHWISTDAVTNATMTIEWCLEYCRSRGMAYAGLKNRNQCYCGRGSLYEMFLEPNNKCGRPCQGNRMQNCGGANSLAVYQTSMGSCGGHVNESGVLYSPGFPGNYPNNQNCTWILSASKENTIQIEILFHNFGGANDSVTMKEVIDGIRYDIGRFEKASDLSEAIFSYSNEIYVTFNSAYGQDVGNGIFVLYFEEAEVGCQLPIGIENGNFRITGDSPHSYFLHFTCMEGFQATGPGTVTCRENRQWTSPFPECLVIDCGEPEEVPNASKEGNIYTYRNTVNYTCNDGYYIDGHDVIICKEDGNWSKQPTCILKMSPIAELMPSKTQTGAIVGSVIGVLILIALIIIIIILCRRRDSFKKVTRSDIFTFLPRMKSRRQSDIVLAEKQSNEYQDSHITVIDMTNEGYLEGETREDGTVPLSSTNVRDQQETSVRSEDDQRSVKKQGMGAWFKMKRKKTAKDTSEGISNVENRSDKDEDSRKRTLIERDKTLPDKGSYAPGEGNGDDNPRYLENVGNHNGVTVDHNHGHDTFQHSTNRGSKNAKINRSGRFKKQTSKSEINRDFKTAKSMDIQDTIAGKSALSEQMSAAGCRHNDTTTGSETPDDLSEDDDPYSEIDSHGNFVEKLVDDSGNNKDIKEKYGGKMGQQVLKELVHSESFRKRSLRSSTADHDKLKSADSTKREPRSGDQFKMAENVLYDFGDDPEHDKDGIYESVGDNEEGFVDNILYEPSGSDSKDLHAADGAVSQEDAKKQIQTQVTSDTESSIKRLNEYNESRKATLMKVSFDNTEKESPMDLSTDGSDDSDENNLYSEIGAIDREGFVDNVIYQDSFRESGFQQSKEHQNKGQEVSEMFKDEELGEDKMVDNILYESAGSLVTAEDESADNKAENQVKFGRHKVNIVKESDGKGQAKEGYLQKMGKIVLPSQAKSPDGRDQAPKQNAPKLAFQPPLSATFEKNQSNEVSEKERMCADEDVVRNAKVHDDGKANVGSEMKTDGGDLQFEVDKQDRNNINAYDIVGGDDDEVEYELAGPNIGMTGSGTNISEHSAKNEVGYLDKGNTKSKPAMIKDSSKAESDSETHTPTSDVETRPTENVSDNKSFGNLVDNGEGMVDNIIYESSNDLIGDDTSRIYARTMETLEENSEVSSDGPQGKGKLRYLAKLGQKVDELKSNKKPENSPSSVDSDKANIEEPFFKYTAEGKTEPPDVGAHLQKDSNNESEDRIDGHINTSETGEGIVDNVLYESSDSILGN